jgi:TolA-binding protein
MWNAFLGLEERGGTSPARPEGGPHLEDLAPTLDEQRVLYAFYLSHPHPSKSMRDAIGSARRGAHDAKACQALVEAERAATESWRLERIARVAALDPAYPADYARGIATFRRGEYRASAASFRKWLDAHPDGALALRAQNFLRAAADADQVE